MPSFAATANSRGYSWEDLAFDTPTSPSTPPELISDSSSDNESGPATPISETGPPSPPVGSLHSYRPSWMAPVDTEEVFESPLNKNRRRQTGRIPSNLPSIEYVLRDADIPDDRGRCKTRRYPNAHPVKQSRSPMSPDRFIPQREFATSPSTSFRVSKNPRELSPDEKLLRRRSKRVDPFRSARRLRSISRRRGPQHVRSPHYSPHLVNDSTIAGPINLQGSRGAGRQVSFGAVWNVGGRSAAQGNKPSVAVSDGNGGLLSSGTTAPMHIAEFFSRPTSPEAPERHESRIAVALDIDPASRLLNTCNLSPPSKSTPSPSSPGHNRFSPSVWKDGAWIRTDGDQGSKAASKDHSEKSVPTQPFRILDAPDIRDDFYCSLLAYSATTGHLAVGLGHRVYLWNEALKVMHPPFQEQHPSNYVTSLSFSSEDGEKSILAVGRRGCTLTLWSPFDTTVRFEIRQPYPITCISFKPTKSRRLSQKFDFEVDVEDLVVGDDRGNVWYFSVEWPDNSVRDRYHWNGAMALLAKISAHTQSICGFAWSPDDIYLATGGNDNSCLLFDLREIIPSQEPQEVRCVSRSSCHSQQSQATTRCQSALSCLSSHTTVQRAFSGRQLIGHLIPSWIQSRFSPLSTPVLSYTSNVSGDQMVLVPPDSHKHRLFHSAAVKAIAFAPWQPSLLATGGGTNDRTIRFFHTPSGSCLATINVHSQVTSLIWSNTHREIVATFGFARPEHPIRIAVFAWPSCEQIAAIPWGPGGTSWDGGTNNELVCGRALYAIRYPGCPRYFAPEDQERCSLETSRPIPPNVMQRDGQTVLCPRLRTPVEPKAKEGGLWCSRTLEEGCIVVASTDHTVKFHEVWGGTRRVTAHDLSPLGGSPLLEEFEGVETLGDEVIR